MKKNHKKNVTKRQPQRPTPFMGGVKARLEGILQRQAELMKDDRPLELVKEVLEQKLNKGEE